MRRFGVALVTTVALAAGALAGTAAPASATSVALGGCGWQPTLAGLNTPASLRAGTLSLSGFAPVHVDVTADIDWRLNPYLDPTWQLWFHSLKWMESLVTSGDPSDLALARHIVEDFVADNPDPGTNGGPWDDHATSFRTSLFVCMWDRTAGGSPEDTAFRGWLEPILRAHAAVVLNRYVGPWNHGTMQSLALLAAGCILDEASWRDAAAVRLRNELLAGIDAQGAITEQAPGYAAFIQSLHRDAQAHLAACGMPVDTALYDRLALVDTFAAQATRPGGAQLEIGDTWPTAPVAGMGPNSRWLATNGAQGTMPTDLTKIYNAGYVFGRDSWTAATQQYSLRFGPGRYSHGHNDHLAMTYWANGRNVLVDAGYDGYADRTFRTWSRSLQAHNVPIVTGAKFDAAAATQLLGASVRKGAHTYRMRDRAFAGAERYRTVVVDDAMKLMLVRDDVKSDQARSLQVLWHLDPSWSKERVTTTDRVSTATFLSKDRRYRASIIQLAAPRTRFPKDVTTAIRGRKGGSIQGWVSRYRGDHTPAWVVEARRPAAKAQNVVTLILVTPVNQTVKAAWVRPKGSDRIRVTVGRTTRVYTTARRGTTAPK